MPPLSATEAISPAWQHTRRLLLGPRDPRQFLKLTALAFFAEVLSSTFSFSPPMHGHHGGVSGGGASTMTAAIIGIVIVAASVGLLFGLLFFYLSSRLQFTLFHAVLRSETFISPIWRRYGAATWRWMGLKLLLFAGAFACLAPLLIPAVLMMIRAVTLQSHGDNSHMVGFVFMAFSLVGLLMTVALALAVATILLRDFALPSMALEGTPLRETIRRVLALVRAEPGPVALYLLLRFCLGIAGMWISYIALGIVALVVGAPLGGLGFGLWAALHSAGTAARAGMVGGWAILALALLAALVVSGISLLGYLFTFLQAYAIFFLGGRYPLLGQLLVEPPAQLRPAPQPQPWMPSPIAPPMS